MKNKVIWACLAAGWVVYTGFFWPVDELEVTKTHGNATVLVPGEYQKFVSQGHLLEIGTVLTTYHKSTLDVSLKDFASFRLLPHSQCTVIQTDAGTIKLSQTLGDIVHHFENKKRNRRFIVDTPTAIVTAKGTQFWSRVDSDKHKNIRTTLAVREGTVEVQIKATREKRSIAQGEAVEIPYDTTGEGVNFRLATTDEMGMMAQASGIKSSSRTAT